mgnify:CR=1 FL=1
MPQADELKKQALIRLCDQPQPPLLMFDYDGTLAPFVVDRDQAFPFPEAKRLLEEIRLKTLAKVVIVSGRPVEDVARLLALEPRLETWGCHGWERCSATGELSTGELPGAARKLFVELESWLVTLKLHQCVELKPASIALHWRGLEESEQRILEKRARQKWAELAGDKLLQLHEFDGGLEWRLPGWSKADAVKTLLRESRAGTPVAYFGDDLTDEDAFRALPEGGVAVLVRDQPRDSAAELWLRPPNDLMHFLRMLLERLRHRHERKAKTGEPQ